ncbi:MAG: hypothetical protein ACRDHP_18585, partial [Ktedonobacterales bacterium]
MDDNHSAETPDAGERRLVTGGKPGNPYMRIRVPDVQTLRWHANGVLEAQQPLAREAAAAAPPANGSRTTSSPGSATLKE